ncbi:MAG TPA: sigma factor [Gammaproteobacteria bacterium]|jgi:RNA polymerase sigma factor (sigma-70 family)|nr:sigma factor [Candidatus Tectomicrobia bacterium]HZC00630.1 sigma factor [Gammaproteobacteria bacterium]
MDHGSRFNATEILEALRQHDRRTWEDLYNAQWEPLCAFIRVHLGEALACRVDPEDIAQEVFCRAYSSITRFRGEARLETWLRSIAHHTITAIVRERSLERQP